VCLTGKSLKGERHPIRLQLIHRLKVKRYSTGEACTLDQWDADAGRMKPRTKGGAQVNAVLDELATRAKGIVDALVVHGSLSLEAFDKRYRNPKATSDLLAYMEDMAEKLAKDRPGYATTFRNAVSALRKFNEGKPIPFHDLTARRLEEFEAHLRGEGCTVGGIATYMIRVRVAVNKAIAEGLLAKEKYPFESLRQKGYSMKGLKATFRPRALSEADLAKVKAFPFGDHPRLGCTVRLFLFSYYARGINFADIARLTHASIVDGRLQYTRTKTKRKGKGANLSILITPSMQAIMDYFSDRESRFLFPILKGTEATEAEVWSRIKDRLQHVNRDLKAVAKVLGINGDFTFYVARHTYATTLKRIGVAVPIISESMGHKNESITTAYLKQFSDEELDAANQGL
jgi:integrase